MRKPDRNNDGMNRVSVFQEFVAGSIDFGSTLQFLERVASQRPDCTVGPIELVLGQIPRYRAFPQLELKINGDHLGR